MDLKAVYKQAISETVNTRTPKDLSIDRDKVDSFIAETARGITLAAKKGKNAYFVYNINLDRTLFSANIPYLTSIDDIIQYLNASELHLVIEKFQDAGFEVHEYEGVILEFWWSEGCS